MACVCRIARDGSSGDPVLSRSKPPWPPPSSRRDAGGIGDCISRGAVAGPARRRRRRRTSRCRSACPGSARISASMRAPRSFLVGRQSGRRRGKPATALGYGRHDPDAAPRAAVLPGLSRRHEPRGAGGRRLHLSCSAGNSCRWRRGRWSWRTTASRQRGRAGYVYLVMASFGTLALLLAFGLLAGPAAITICGHSRAQHHTL